MTARPLYWYGLVVVALFAAVGAGVGLAINFTLGFFIEQFADPGDDPLSVTQVAILFLASILLVYAFAPVVAGVAGAIIGWALPQREVKAAVVGGFGSFLGYFLFVGVALFLLLAVLSTYGPPPGGDGNSNGGGPLDPGGLAWLTVQVSLPVGLVGFVSAYVGSRFG